MPEVLYCPICHTEAMVSTWIDEDGEPDGEVFCVSDSCNWHDDGRHPAPLLYEELPAAA